MRRFFGGIVACIVKRPRSHEIHRALQDVRHGDTVAPERFREVARDRLHGPAGLQLAPAPKPPDLAREALLTR